MATIKNIFSARTHDFITSIDNRGIIVVRELTSAETYDDLENIAHMLVDMLGTEAMTQAWVAYSNTANDLKDLSNAYKEARTALEIGKIFYAERNVFGYRTLGTVSYTHLDVYKRQISSSAISQVNTSI